MIGKRSSLFVLVIGDCCTLRNLPCTYLFFKLLVQRLHVLANKYGHVYVPGLSADTPESPESLPTDDEDNDVPMPFAGDLFGQDYDLQDFGLEDEDAGERTDGSGPPSADSDSSSEDDPELERGWEPAPLEHNRTPTPPPNPLARDASHSPPQPPENRLHEAETRFLQKPVVDKFNDSRGRKAGQPINDSVRSLYTEYEERITGSDNPFAPFVSRLDWEVAQWAKMRGPGSTALTELLAIERVGHSLFSSLYYQLTCNKRFAKA